MHISEETKPTHQTRHARRRAGVSPALVMVIAVAGFGLSACKGGLELPGSGQPVAQFPMWSSGQQQGTARASDEPLRVVQTSPRGTARGGQAISVVFNQDMQAPSFGAPIADGPLTISPPIEGAFTWWGSRTVVFKPNKPLPPGQRYKVTVKGDTKSASGASLVNPHTFSFRTQGLTVTSTTPYRDGYTMAPDAKLSVRFNMEVDPEVARKGISLKGAGGAIPVTIEPYSYKTKRDGKEVTITNKRQYTIKPTSRLSGDSSFTLTIDGSITPAGGGAAMDRLYRRTFKTYGALAVQQIRCGWGKNCRPTSSINVRFNNPVNPKDLESCVSVSPRGVAKISYSYGNQINLRPEKGSFTPGQTITVDVKGGCKDRYGNALARSSSASFTIGDEYPRMDMRHGFQTFEPDAPGGKLVFPVSMLNMGPMRLRMQRIAPEQLAAFTADLSRYNAPDPFARQAAEVARPLKHKEVRNKEAMVGVDLREVLGKRDVGIVYLDLQKQGATTVSRRYPNGRRPSSWALVQLTKLALNVKSGPIGTQVWVTDVSTAAPVAGVTVSFWDKKGQRAWSGTTDAQGLVTGPSAKPKTTTGSRSGASSDEVVTVIAQRGEDTAFVNLKDYQTQVPLYSYRLNTSYYGEGERVQGSLFTERGVYRAGETVHLTGVLRKKALSGLELMPAGTRVGVEVTDPRGDLVLQREVELSALGGLSFDVALEDSARLGTYSVKALVKGTGLDANAARLFSSFRVEAYRTPRFEVSVKADEGVIVGGKLKATLSGRYLFGAAMQDAPVSYSVRRTSGSFSAARFPDFTFGQRLDNFWWYEDDYDGGRYGSETLASASAKLNARGELVVELPVPKSERFKGPQQATIEATVSDVDRQVISSSRAVTIHPSSFYVGLKHPGYLQRVGAPIEARMVAVDTAGAPVAGKPVTLTLTRRTWKSVRKKSAGGAVTWVNERVDVRDDSCKATSAAATFTCTVKASKPGYYIMEAASTDAAGNPVLSREDFYVWGDGDDSWWQRSDDARIQLVADRDDYKVGDTARILVQSPFKKARALVTVERAGVLTRRVIEIKGSSQTIEVPITADLVPNAFVSVVLVRGRVGNDKALKKDARGRLFDPGKPSFKMGYLKLDVDQSVNALKVDVAANKKTYRPGEEVEVAVTLKDASGKPVGGEVTIMAVDEGVLSLTGYKTPDLMKTFFREDPLSVQTRDSRRALISRLEVRRMGNKGLSGGDGLAESFGASVNFRGKFITTAAFKPLVKVGADGKATARFKLPDNLTAFRLMAVASSGAKQFGSGQSRITVNKPLLVRAALPRFASTGDAFGVRAVVQSLDGFSGKVTIAAQTEGPISLSGAPQQVIELAAGEAREVVFPATAGEPGEATVRFAVTGKDAEDAVEIKLPVQLPSPVERHVETLTMTVDKPTQWRRLTLPETMHPTEGELVVELSSSRFSELLPGIDYLVDYPYGCAEQTTGRVLPMVMLGELLDTFELQAVDRDKLPTYTQAGIDRLFTMQTPSGGLGYWPGAYQAHPWASTYATLAIVQAKKRGFKVNEARYQRLLKYTREVLKMKARVNTRYWNQRARMAASVLAAYVLAEAGQPDASYNERLFNQRAKLPRWGQALLIMAIHKQKQGGPLTDRKAQLVKTLSTELMQHVTTESGEAHLGLAATEPQDYWVTMHSSVRADALALMAMLRVDPQADVIELLARGLLNARRGGRWLSTQDNAFALMALSEYFSSVERVAPSYDVTVGVGDKAIATEAFRGRKLGYTRVRLPMKDVRAAQGKILTIMRDGEGGPLYANLKLRHAQAKPDPKALHQGFSLKREYLRVSGKDAGKPATSVKPGEVVEVRLTLVAPAERHYVAVDDPLPAGFEIINTSFATQRAQGLDASYHWNRLYPSHREQRDDRMLLFVDTMRPGVFTYSYLVRATTPGTFQVAGATIHEMYHPNVQGRSPALVVDVK